jgi:hypothetical protein
MTTVELQPAHADSATKIQQAVDAAAVKGGRVVLPEMDLTLDRGIELRSGVELIGRGEGTILRKGPGRVFPLAGYHNYGMHDAPLRDAAGLAPGMTVSVFDNLRRNFYETFARITWIDGSWIGLDRGLAGDYADNQEPRLTTLYPLIFGRGVRNAAVRHLCLDGRADDQETGMNPCRGAALYLYQSRDVVFEDVAESDYRGEGLGFQMCRDIRILGCTFDGNTGNGFHPGAGSTNCLFQDCVARGNADCGFYFCVRANHITVKDCRFDENTRGISIGERDCANLIEGCAIARNRGPGLLIRRVPPSCAVHSVTVRNCSFSGNARESQDGQIVVEGPAHDVLLEGNRLACDDRDGIRLGDEARRIQLRDNQFQNCRNAVAKAADCLGPASTAVAQGYGSGGEEIFRHLAPVWERPTRNN